MEPSTCASPAAPLRESERTRRRPLPTCHRYHTPSICASSSSSSSPSASPSSSSPVTCSRWKGAWWMVVVVGLVQCPRGALGFFTPWHRVFVHRTHNHHHQQQQQGPAAAPSPLSLPAPPPARSFGSFFRPLSLQFQSLAGPLVLAASRVPSAVGRSKTDGSSSKKRGRKPKAASASSSTRATSHEPPSSLSSSSPSSSSSSSSASLSSVHDAYPADPMVLSASRVPSAVGTSQVDNSSNSSSKKRGRRPKAASASSSARATSDSTSSSSSPSSSSVASYPPHDALTLSASRVPSAVGRSQSGGDDSGKKRGRKPRSASASSSTKATSATDASSSALFRNETMASPTSMYATAGVLERPAAAAPAKPRVGRGEEPPPASTEEANPFDGEDSGGYMEGSMSAKQLRNYIDEERDASAYAREGLASKPDKVVAIPEPEVLPAPVPVAAKKKPRASRKTLVEPDWTVKTEDDVCRATINVISTGDESDLAMITPFVERLLTRYGDRIEILHRPFVPEDKPGIRLLEIWFEGFECFQLYSRYQYLKRGKRGELTPDLIDEMCEKIDWAMYLDATGDYGPAL